MPVDRGRLARDAVDLAPRLLGAVVSARVGNAEVAIRLTEVEAYEGLADPASHAFRGRTARTAVMFGPPGFLYCYFTYGMHWCANIVCASEGQAAAVLLRAGDVVSGLELARARRPAARTDSELARGPARLATCLGLGRAHNGADLCDPTSAVTLDSMPRRPPAGISAGPRVGITAATEHAWRFWLTDAASVSVYRPGGRRTRAARHTDSRE